MNITNHPIVAVVSGPASRSAEKELLKGIITENKNHGYATVVLSNIFNASQVDEHEDLSLEQSVYNLIESDQIDGIIVFCESFSNENIRNHIASLLKNKNVPVIGIGTKLKEFENLNMVQLNTSDVDDIYRLTSHLIEVHSFNDIAILTGYETIEASVLRVEGYKKALRDHGIEPDDKKIYYGDFWLFSGSELAERYVKGEIPIPQAVICANDMMAYGMLDYFSYSAINVPEHITVVSYESSDMRLYYSPLLTSLKRNYEALGTIAAQRIHSILENKTLSPYTPPEGTFITGESCPCRCNEKHTITALRTALRRRDNYDLNLFSGMEHKLARCHNMEEFIRIIDEYNWMIRAKSNMYIRLFSDWYNSESPKSDTVLSRKILNNKESTSEEKNQFDLRYFFEDNCRAAVCYLTPLFSEKQYFGQMVLIYNEAESYDDVYRHWMKSICIGLEYLKLKSDIRTLMECQNAAEYHDVLTGLYNEKGLRRAYRATSEYDNGKLFFVMIKIDLFPRLFDEKEIQRKNQAISGIPKALDKICVNHGITGRLSNDTFVCIIQSKADADMLADLFSVLLLQEHVFIEYFGTTSFICHAAECNSKTFDELTEECSAVITEKYNAIKERRKNRHYQKMIAVRNKIYSSPEITFDPDSENMYTNRIDLFRRNYRECFGLPFHQDCIRARIAKAKYYLTTTTLNITNISDKCGYCDNKYFQRQFVSCTNLPALKYRELMS